MRILSEQDVRAAVDMEAAVDAVARAFAALSSGEAEAPVRLALESEGGPTLYMPARLGAGVVGEEPIVGAKVVTITPANGERGLPVIQAVVMLLDAVGGGVRALLEGTWLTALRTGASGGVAAKLLARTDASVVALFGAGVQARTQLEAVRCVREVSEVRVVSRTRASADRLVAELEGIAARRVEHPGEALRGAHVVIAATSSSTPVFDGRAVEPGAHVTGVGSFTPDMREVDATLVRRARVFVDQRAAALAEAGDLLGPIRDGAFDASMIVGELGDVVRGAVPGRTSDEEITFFKSVGNAVQDLAVAALVLRVAEQRGLGMPFDL